MEKNCFNENFVDQKEQEKANQQVKNIIDFLISLLEKAELKNFEYNGQKFKEILLQKCKNKYPSIATQEDIKEYIKNIIEQNAKLFKSKDKEQSIESFANSIKDDLFVEKNTFIFNKKMEKEIQEFAKNPLRLQNDKMGFLILSFSDFLVDNIDEKIAKLFKIPVKMTEMSMSEQIFVRYRIMTYNIKSIRVKSIINKFLQSNKELFEKIKKENRLSSIDRQKILTSLDIHLFPEDVFDPKKGKIKGFLMHNFFSDWNLEKNDTSIGYKIQQLLPIIMAITAVVGVILMVYNIRS